MRMSLGIALDEIRECACGALMSRRVQQVRAAKYVAPAVFLAALVFSQGFVEAAPTPRTEVGAYPLEVTVRQFAPASSGLDLKLVCSLARQLDELAATIPADIEPVVDQGAKQQPKGAEGAAANKKPSQKFIHGLLWGMASGFLGVMLGSMLLAWWYRR